MLSGESSPSTPITTVSVSRGLGIIELALAKTSVCPFESFFSQSIFLADHPTPGSGSLTSCCLWEPISFTTYARASAFSHHVDPTVDNHQISL